MLHAAFDVHLGQLKPARFRHAQAVAKHQEQRATAAGRAAAVARGVRMGRRRLLSAQQVAHARKLIEQGEGPNNEAKSLMVSRRTLYRALAPAWSTLRL